MFAPRETPLDSLALQFTKPTGPRSALVITNNHMENVCSHLGGTRGSKLLVAALVKITLGIGGLVEITAKAALSSLQ
ncbi:MAG: hypothetical protein KIH08_01660 [Candidatus Freyarchaeota archaeon]|nr:hypothetical protein [Candidatus Jordarchaeia archaeon]MBS7268806.1 hypothetical protein [Candidatus Jordarchaeia archaeon]MBS7279157.1 hypothetical protein [Candidatus Jordarchaeia archaeon]